MNTNDNFDEKIKKMTERLKELKELYLNASTEEEKEKYIQEGFEIKEKIDELLPQVLEEMQEVMDEGSEFLDDEDEEDDK